MRDDRVRASGPCAQHEDGHTTREEAERHFYEWTIARLGTVLLKDAQRKCEICGAWTDGGLVPGSLGRVTVLCEDHRTKEHWAGLNPFEPGLSIVSST